MAGTSPAMTEARNFARVKAIVDRRQKATITSALASSFVSGHDTRRLIYVSQCDTTLPHDPELQG
jgi:hypothetical protein